MAEQITIREGKNEGIITGTLNEKNIMIISDTVEVDGKNVPSETIKGSFTVDTGDNNVITVNLRCGKITKQGKENGLFKGYKTIATECVSKAELAKREISYKTGTENTPYDKMQVVTIAIPENVTEAEKLECQVKLDIQDYYSVRGNKMISKLEPKLFVANRVAQDTPNKAEMRIEGATLSIRDEFNKNEEETGRKIMTLVSIGYGGKAIPIEVILPETIEDIPNVNVAEVVSEGFPVGTTGEHSIKYVSRQVGGEANANNENVFLGQMADVSTGYTITELEWFGALNPYTEDSVGEKGERLAYTREEIQTAMNERRITLETRETEGKEKAKKPAMSPSTVSAKKQAVSDEKAKANVDSWF